MNNENISRFTNTLYLNTTNSQFYITSGGLLGIKVDDKDMGRAILYRMFPLSNEQKYISVRNKKEEELGIIDDLAVFDKDQLALITNELNRRYFLPKILKVINVKEEFNYLYFEVETNSGYREFTVGDIANSTIRLKNNRVIIVDVDGNRYEFEDITKAGDKTLRFIGVWL